ncbi:hypothetical protein TSUD_127110 [Trifolium subterraneum]|nr:hypothetical protein TSUD_127110 [Trifolium subterraneum]
MKHSLSKSAVKREPIMKHSLSPSNSMKRKLIPQINDEKKKKPATEKIMKHSLSEAKTMKRNSLTEINEERKKKKKPTTVIDSSPQSSTLGTIIDERFPEMIRGECSRSSCGICFDFMTDSDMFKRKHCNHLFCVECISKCKCSFCYHCGKKWKFGHTCKKRRHSLLHDFRGNSSAFAG